jgi:ABC-type antimicrobial peptide transport system permease subunit
MNQLQADGNTGTVRLTNNDFQIAGTYKALFKQSNVTRQGNGIGSVFIPSELKGVCYLKFAHSAEMKDVHAKVEAICRKYVPHTLPLEITSLDKDTDSKVDTILLMMKCGMLLGIVSIILVILSVYSAISIDTVGRQKEIAIRKINGASGKDIASLFAKPYILVYLISFVFVYPLLRLMLIGLTDGYMDVAYQWDWVIGLFFGFALLLFIVTAEKIWEVMNLNPASIIKKE